MILSNNFTYKQARAILQEMADRIPDEDKICEKYCMSISPAEIDRKGRVIIPERTKMIVGTDKIRIDITMLDYDVADDSEEGGQS